MSFYDDEDKPLKPKKPRLESLLLPLTPQDDRDDPRVFTEAGSDEVRRWLDATYETDPTLAVDVHDVYCEFQSGFSTGPNCYCDFIRVLSEEETLYDGDGPDAKRITDKNFATRNDDTFLRTRKTSALKVTTGWNSEVQPIEWLIDGILPKGSVCMIVGASYELKTWVAMSMEKAAAYREPWLGYAFDPCKVFERAPRVLHVNFDMPESEVANRFVMLGDKPTFTPTPDGLAQKFVATSRVLQCSHPGVSLLDDAFWHGLEVGKYDFVVIDALQSGNTRTDEKDPRIAEPLRRAGAFAEKHGTTFLFVHHSPKCTGTESLLEIIRGSTAIPAGVDVVFFVKKVSKFATNDRTERRSVLVCKKMRRGGTEPPPFTVKLTDAGGMELCEERRGKAPTSKASTDEDALFEAIAKNPGIGGKRPLIKATGLSEERVHLARRKLLDSERIENRGTPTRPEYHVRAP